MLIEKEYIYIDAALRTEKEAMEFIGEKALYYNITNDKNRVIEDLFDRELEFCTNLGMGLSIPHTKSQAINKPAVFFIRYKDEIEWGNESKVKASVVFLSPKNSVDNIHLKMLSNVSRKLVHDEFREVLLYTGDKEEIYRGLSDALNNI